MYRIGKTLLTGLFLLLSSIVMAQNTCSQTLIKAQIAYYEGRADEVPSILADCLKEGFTDEEKSQAYRLLTLTHLYLNESQNAENTMLSFLRLNHYYKINEAVDPTEFINLYNQFRTRPFYLISPKIGTNVSFIQVLKNFSPDNTKEVNYSYHTVLGYRVGAAVGFPIHSKITINTEIYLSGKNYAYKNNLFGYEALSFNEKQTHIELPVLASYSPKNDKWLRPFVQGGFSADVLLNAMANVSRIDQTNDIELKKQVTGPSINLNTQRRRLNYNAILGGGVTYTRGKNIMIVDVRYSFGLLNAVKPKNRYTNTELVYKYGYMDNDIRLNAFSVSVGYVIPVFRPKKNVKQKLEVNTTVAQPAN
ncbi:PorT family protein [Rhodocytophaga rosea]|uniref:PorT family protein n=1 Tax=Rhodocytophaga rosea TaxID=2704465 RepID=A0A6C0GMN7_9BACT|nr:porin family protein [Rhodocytophaga rosea]QHT68893.1 PorT family protein [Rhodocytophaga rosea]